MEGNKLLLLISQLDGTVTALKFGSEELPPILSASQQARVFQLKYGMDAGSSSMMGGMLMGRNTQQSRFIESALSMVQHEEESEPEDDDRGNDDDNNIHSDDQAMMED